MFNDLPICKIIHVDMDAFYASVEQWIIPNRGGLPLAVGGLRTRRGERVSYQARKFGVKRHLRSFGKKIVS